MRQFDTPPHEPSDADLVSRAQAGDDAFFVMLIQRHNQSVYRVVRSVLRDEAAVEEVMQDTYLNAFTHLQALTGGGAFATWVRKIAFHGALDRVKSARRSPFSEVDLGSLAPVSPLAGPDHDAGRAQLRRALQEAVDLLPEGYREVFMLRSVDGRSVAETATVLGVGEETVKTRMFRARAKLQQTLAGWGELDARRTFAFPAVRCARVGSRVIARLRLN